MINLYPLDETYSKIIDKKINGETLNNFEISNDSYFNEHIDRKAIEYASMIKNLEAEQNAINDAIKILDTKYFTMSKRIERLRYDLKQLLDINDIRKIKTPFFDITISLNNPGTIINDESLIPDDYIKETISKRIDKIKLLKDLKQGVLIPGAQIEQKTRLEIK
jgi:hypothetical protein